MLIEHVTMSGDSYTTEHEIRACNCGRYTDYCKCSEVDFLSFSERRKLDRAYRIAARKRDKKRLGQ